MAGSREERAEEPSARPSSLAVAPVSSGAVLNPLRSEQEAFRFLIYVAVVFGVIIAVVLIVRAL